MVDTKSALDQIHVLQIIVTKLWELNNTTLEELQEHLRFKKETKSCDPKNKIVDSSKVHLAKASTFQKNFEVNNDKKSSNGHKKFSGKCLFCKKKGHRQDDCRNKNKTE